MGCRLVSSEKQWQVVSPRWMRANEAPTLKNLLLADRIIRWAASFLFCAMNVTSVKDSRFRLSWHASAISLVKSFHVNLTAQSWSIFGGFARLNGCRIFVYERIKRKLTNACQERKERASCGGPDTKVVPSAVAKASSHSPRRTALLLSPG